MDRYVHAIFCDDIRVEQGEKISIIGHFSSSVTAMTFPVFLPKLCAVLWASSPITQPFRSVTAILTIGDREVLRQPLDMPPDAAKTWKDGTTTILLTANLVISPFQVEEPTTVTVSVRFDDESKDRKVARLDIVAQP